MGLHSGQQRHNHTQSGKLVPSQVVISKTQVISSIPLVGWLHALCQTAANSLGLMVSHGPGRIGCMPQCRSASTPGKCLHQSVSSTMVQTALTLWSVCTQITCSSNSSISKGVCRCSQWSSSRSDWPMIATRIWSAFWPVQTSFSWRV